MLKSMLFLLAMVICASVSFADEVAPVDPEFRGMWITRFEWTQDDPESTRQYIIDAMDKLERNNFNAAVFQVRGAAEVLYPSPYEPWSPLLGEEDPGFDPMQLAIDEAHSRGLEFHAYVNPMPMRSTRWGSPPADLSHIYYSHGPGTEDSWLVYDEQGNESSSEYLYMSPGIPEVHEYLRRVLMDIVLRYDVDGLHLDRIRYPGPNYSHDSVSERRFRGRGNPNMLDWEDWQREQLDKFINDLAAEMRAVKPNVVLSCAAWGIYNRHLLDGYGGFSSGYHDYYQDTWRWVRLGAMDILMPMIYWDIPEPKPNYDELAELFIENIGAEHFVGGQRMFSPEENVQEIEVTRALGGLGTVLFSLGSAERRGIMTACRDSVYHQKAPVPVMTRISEPTTGTILGKVVDKHGNPLVDAWVRVKDDSGNRLTNQISNAWTSGSDGRFAFLDVPPRRVKIIAEYAGVSKTVKTLPIEPGKVYETTIEMDQVDGSKSVPFVTILSPDDRFETSSEVFHLLGKTVPGYKATIGGKAAEVYSTGGFVRDNIPLEMGENKIPVVVRTPEGETAEVTVNVTRRDDRRAIPPAPLVKGGKETKIVEPSEDVALMPGDALDVKVSAETGKQGFVRLFGTDVPLTEADGLYQARVRIPADASNEPQPVVVYFDRPGLFFADKTVSESTVQVWPTSRVGETEEDGVGVVYGLHSVRLGGPYLTEMPQGVRFEVIGRLGRQYKVRLSNSMIGWVSGRNVKLLPEGTPVPHNYFTSGHIGGDENYDTFSVSLNEKVPFSITAQIDPDNKLLIDFFNTHHAVTWMSHKTGAQIIGPVSAEQLEDDRLRLTIPLNCKQIWGYWTEFDGNRLTLYVRRPPQIAQAPESPLEGLKFALEAGHGGSGSGAMGRLGTKEKTVNLMAVMALKNLLEEKGAETVLVRPKDSNPSLGDRVRATNDSGADFFIAIHANAASTAGGYLRVSGTSTYYKDDFCYLPAKLIYDKLLSLDWGEFGVVGNFSYYPLRNTRTPGILIEQAFMSNPSDEARLTDPEYQRQQAQVTVEALEEFFAKVRE